MKVALYISRILLTVASLNGCASAPPAPEVEIPAPVAKSGASFEVTREFIVANLESYGGMWWNPGEKDILSNANIDSACTLTFTYRVYFAGEHQDVPYSTATVTIPLGAVTQLATTTYMGGPPRAGIQLKTGDVTAISVSGDREAMVNAASPTNMYNIYILNSPRSELNGVVPDSPSDMQARLRRALAHMVDICHGTYAPTEAPQQPF